MLRSAPGIIFTKFDLQQLIRAWIIAFFMLIRHVKLQPWPLTRWSESSWYIKRHVIKICTKFERNRAIPGWSIDNFANFCTRYITPWPWPLTSWFTALRVSCVKTLYKIWAKSNYRRFSAFLSAILGVGQNWQFSQLHQTWQDIEQSSQHCSFVSEFGYLAAFSNAGGSK